MLKQGGFGARGANSLAFFCDSAGCVCKKNRHTAIKGSMPVSLIRR
jgi:hypothetical protein